MTETDNIKVQDRLQDRVEQVAQLLRRHRRYLESLEPHESNEGGIWHTDASQHLSELQSKLNELHNADIAQILEALPLDDRLAIWNLIKADRDGDILIEVADSVRPSLLGEMDTGEMLAAARDLDVDELAHLASDLPHDVVQEIFDSLDAQQKARVRSALSYSEDQVGAYMDFEMVTIREDVTLEVVLRYVRRWIDLPNQTDKLFVVNSKGILTGVLQLKHLLVNDVDALVSSIMSSDPVTFFPDELALQAAQAFQRYDLVSAPVIDQQGHLIGRLTIDEMVDVIHEEGESEVLNMAGLREEEDIFASVWHSIKNRWGWLAVNLVTAFIASRVIGLFDGTIEKLVALAALMPIVAGIGGNSGNQTTTMIIRALALNQVSIHQSRRLIKKELGVALINGLVLGGVIGVVAALLYSNMALGVVMLSAMTLNLILAALMGVLIPMLMLRLGRDPAMGTSVMITAVTDSGGFFIFLGLASLFLL